MGFFQLFLFRFFLFLVDNFAPRSWINPIGAGVFVVDAFAKMTFQTWADIFSKIIDLNLAIHERSVVLLKPIMVWA